jgi:hypothetical protein
MFRLFLIRNVKYYDYFSVLALSVVCALLLVIYICTVFYLCMRKVKKIYTYKYTVTKPYAGFRHPDRMEPDQNVRGREHFVPRPCWNFTFLHSGGHFRHGEM